MTDLVVPEGWSRARVDRVATVTARIGWKALTASEYVDEGYVFLSTPNIKHASIDFENVNYITEYRYQESPELALQPDDVLLVKDGNTLGITNIVTELPRAATVNGSIAVLRPIDVEPRFLRYSLDGTLVQGLIGALRAGMGVPHLFQFDINRLPLLLPPRAEQRAIADFLDTETARIDALIAKKQQLRSVLEEHEQAVLVEALGDWRFESMVSLRQLKTSVLTGPFGTQLAASEYVEGGVPVINPTHIADGDLKPESHVTVSPEVALRLARHRLQRGDIVLGRKGDVGRSALITEVHAGWICGSDSIAIRTDERRLLPEFLIRVLQSKYYRQQLASRSTGATMLNVNESILLGFSVPALDLDTQHAVVGEVDHALARHTQIGVRLDEQLALLREHRQALVTAAVTGEIEVPGVAA